MITLHLLSWLDMKGVSVACTEPFLLNSSKCIGQWTSVRILPTTQCVPFHYVFRNWGNNHWVVSGSSGHCEIDLGQDFIYYMTPLYFYSIGGPDGALGPCASVSTWTLYLQPSNGMGIPFFSLCCYLSKWPMFPLEKNWGNQYCMYLPCVPPSSLQVRVFLTELLQQPGTITLHLPPVMITSFSRRFEVIQLQNFILKVSFLGLLLVPMVSAQVSQK